MNRLIDGYCGLLARLIALLLAAMVVLVFGNVVLRYVFNSGITVSEEISRWLFVWMTFLGAIVALKEHGHLGTDILVGRLGNRGKKLCLVSILRAGNGLLEGMLDLLPSARIGHIGLYRDPVTLKPVEYYFKVPSDIGERPVIVVDPMLATGNSTAYAIQKLKDAGAKDVRLVCLLAAPEGIRRVAKDHPDVAIYTAAVDSHLNDHGYIVPGLGDAGDRMFGTK